MVWPGKVTFMRKTCLIFTPATAHLFRVIGRPEEWKFAISIGVCWTSHSSVTFGQSFSIVWTNAHGFRA